MLEGLSGENTVKQSTRSEAVNTHFNYVNFLSTVPELQDILQEASRLFPSEKTQSISWAARQEKILANWQDKRGDIFIACMEHNVPPQNDKCQLCRTHVGIVR